MTVKKRNSAPTVPTNTSVVRIVNIIVSPSSRQSFISVQWNNLSYAINIPILKILRPFVARLEHKRSFSSNDGSRFSRNPSN